MTLRNDIAKVVGEKQADIVCDLVYNFGFKNRWNKMVKIPAKIHLDIHSNEWEEEDEFVPIRKEDLYR
jgi:hypothetical protein